MTPIRLLLFHAGPKLSYRAVEGNGSMKLILASASPRRRELLERIGISPAVHVSDIDESRLPGEDASDYVLRVALKKARSVRDLLSDNADDSVVLAADTAVLRDGEPLGKPTDPADARGMLASLSGRTHEVLTAVVAIGVHGTEHSLLARATVTFTSLNAEEIDWYVATGEPMDKAGSYAIQGLGAVLIDRVEGDPSAVIGLPLRPTVELLRDTGFVWPGFTGAV